jgi:predicted NUDIX family NTP pyrophosphohydrolase
VAVVRTQGQRTIPKCENEPDEELLAATLHESRKKIGVRVDPTVEFVPLGSIQQKGGKFVHAWATKQDWDNSRTTRSNLFKMEWPLGSGTMREFPEVDRVQFFPVHEAKRKLKPTQLPLIERLNETLGQEARNPRYVIRENGRRATGRYRIRCPSPATTLRASCYSNRQLSLTPCPLSPKSSS